MVIGSQFSDEYHGGIAAIITCNERYIFIPSMTRNYQQSDWKFSAWDFSNEAYGKAQALYPEERMRDIVKAARIDALTKNKSHRTRKATYLRKAVINLAAWTQNWKYLADRPSPAQRRATLMRLADSLSNTNEILNGLDSDTLDDLRIIIADDPISVKLLAIPDDCRAPIPLFSYVRLDNLRILINSMEQWSKLAAAKSRKAKKDGDLPADIKRWYVEGLIKIWLGVGHKKPTVTTAGSYTKGAFMEFAKLASEPLGLWPLEATIRKEIQNYKLLSPKKRRAK